MTEKEEPQEIGNTENVSFPVEIGASNSSMEQNKKVQVAEVVLLQATSLSCSFCKITTHVFLKIFRKTSVVTKSPKELHKIKSN